MASIPGTIPVTGTFAPTDTIDVFAIMDMQYVFDGLKNVADKTERNAITDERRKEGMIVGTQDSGEYWRLLSAPYAGDDTDWVLWIGAGGADSLADLTDVTLTSPLANGDILVYNSSNGLWENSPANLSGGDAIKYQVEADRTIDDKDMYTVWGDFTLDIGQTLNNDGKLVIVNGNFNNNGLYIQGGTGSLEIVETNLAYILSYDNKTLGQEMLWTNALGTWVPGESTIHIDSVTPDNGFVTKEWIIANNSSKEVDYQVINDKSIDDKDMYTVWGDFTLDATKTLNNDGRLVIVNGNFNNNGIYNQTVNGSIELVTTNLEYILGWDNKTVGQHILWTNIGGTFIAGESTTAIDASGDNTYVTKEWVNSNSSGKVVITFTPGLLGVANTLLHNIGTADIMVQLWDVVTGEVINADIGNATATTVDITITGANPAGDIKAIII